MTVAPAHTPRSNVTRTMLLATGSYFLFLAVVFNPWLIGAAVGLARTSLHRPWTTMPDAGAVGRMETVYAALAVVVAGAGILVGSVSRLDRAFRGTARASIVLAFLAFFIPVATLEVALRPFTASFGKQTSLFVKDDHLEWRMRPNTTQTWGGVTVTTNSLGFRGPEPAPKKAPGTVRILHLGDSVAFGFGVARWQDTFPFLVDSLLSARGIAVETIDTGVGGYSPWQERIVLDALADRIDPDIVVVNFVLNDVTEKFTLVRYGGLEESRQLRESYHSPLDRLLSHSALAIKVRTFARKWKARRVLGSDPQLAAIKRENFDVDALIHHPEKQHIMDAWRITLESLQGIFDDCAARGIPVLLVVHPFRMQIDNPEENGVPQRTLLAYAREHGVHAIDLLPILHQRLDVAGESPADLYIDRDHYSVAGQRVVAGILADSLQAIKGAGQR